MTDADHGHGHDHSRDDHLERALAAIGDEAAFPDTPDLAARIGGMLPDRPERIVDIHRARPRYRLIAAAVLVIVLLGIGAMLAVPTARESVARWLHVELPGLRIEVLDPDDAPRSSPPSSLGDRCCWVPRPRWRMQPSSRPRPCSSRSIPRWATPPKSGSGMAGPW